MFLSLSLAMAGSGFAAESPVFIYHDVVNRAEELSKQPFVAQNQELAGDLQKLDYDLYFRIRFLTEHVVWQGLPYRLGFFHPGSYFKRRVLMRAIEPDRSAISRFLPLTFTMTGRSSSADTKILPALGCSYRETGRMFRTNSFRFSAPAISGRSVVDCIGVCQLAGLR